MAITPQERELIIIGTAIAAGCKGCLRENALAAQQLHVTAKDVDDTISTAIRIRQAATNGIEKFVSSGFTESAASKPHPRNSDNQRIQALVSVGAAFAINCVTSLKEQIDNAKTIGISEDDINAVVSLSAFMKANAASHVERLMSPYEVEDDTNMLAEYGTPFGPERCAWAEVCKSDKPLYRTAARSSDAGDSDLIEITGAL
jgi:AhpD family alkylhydroperoxidase